MRALFKPSAAPGLEMIECAEPTPGPDDVKFRVEKTGICGTDLHIESWDAWAACAVNAPLFIGHLFLAALLKWALM
jgi:threonine 3-dehydrogenase